MSIFPRYYLLSQKGQTRRGGNSFVPLPPHISFQSVEGSRHFFFFFSPSKKKEKKGKSKAKIKTADPVSYHEPAMCLVPQLKRGSLELLTCRVLSGTVSYRYTDMIQIIPEIEPPGKIFIKTNYRDRSGGAMIFSVYIIIILKWIMYGVLYT